MKENSESLRSGPGSHETYPAHNTVLLPLPEIFNSGEYFSRERVEVLGFGNWGDPSTSSGGNGIYLRDGKP